VQRAVQDSGNEGRQAVPVRAIRGAVQVAANQSTAILEGTSELVAEVMTRNQLTPADVISVVFTATPDLNAEFPALAARKLGFQDVPLLCCTEIDVSGAMPRVVRLLMHVETAMPRSAVQHVYLRGAAALRLDIAQ
jgi:chorismate mutase